MFSTRVLAALAAAVLDIAIAQSPAPAPPSPAEPPVCVKPDAHPGRLASDTRKKQWAKDVNAWNDCMRTHIAELQARANTATAVANKAVEDFNRAAKEFQEQSLTESGR
jgi:hypothetical protein